MFGLSTTRRVSSVLSPVIMFLICVAFWTVILILYYMLGFIEGMITGTSWIPMIISVVWLGLLPMFFFLRAVLYIGRYLFSPISFIQFRRTLGVFLGAGFDSVFLNIVDSSRRQSQKKLTVDELIAKRESGTTIQTSLDGDFSNSDAVEISVFAPKACQPKQTFLVQLLVYLPRDHEAASKLAEASDPGSARRATNCLAMGLQFGDKLDVDLDVSGGLVEEPRQSMVWRGEPAVTQFFVTVSRRIRTPIPIRLTLTRSGVPLGALKFIMPIVAVASDPVPQMRGDMATRFRRAFLSYASSDRTRVINAAQLLNVAGIEVFQDVLSMEPGERWQNRLYAEINDCDLFLLFWSDAARHSKWVVKEAEYALDCNARSRGNAPNIKPVILEGPPVPKPPRRLKQIHFNDRFRYFAASAEREASSN